MTDRRIPSAALALGLAGLIPFVWAAATQSIPTLTTFAASHLPPVFIGTYVALNYGIIILSFMSGALWGFAAKASAGPLPYILSVIPALWAFFLVTDGSDTSIIYLIAGFVGLLLIDSTFTTLTLAPPWWLRLRLILTVGVIACLTVSLL